MHIYDNTREKRLARVDILDKFYRSSYLSTVIMVLVPDGLPTPKRAKRVVNPPTMENDGEGGDPPTAPSIGTTLLAGSCAGVLAQLLIYPFDVVRTRVQATGASVGACLRGALRPASRGGRPSVSGLYVGLSFPLAAQAVYKANVLTANELFSRATAPGSGGEARLPPAARAFLGGCSPAATTPRSSSPPSSSCGTG